MKKLAVLAIVVATCGAVLAGSYKPYSYTVTTNSSFVLPTSLTDGATWATNRVVAQGDVYAYYTNSIPWHFWAVTGGVTGTNIPAWKTDADVTDGTVTWRPHNTVRTRLILQVPIDSTNTVYLGFDGEDAEAGKGVYLLPGGSLSYPANAYQGAVKAVVGSSTGKLNVQEMP